MTSSKSNSATQDQNAQLVIAGRELVRGGERQLLAELRRLVQSQSLCLDLGSVERIDAAGLGALVSLYRDACKAGHKFAVINPSRNVKRILAIVGLDRVLLPKGTGEALAPSAARTLELVA